ncbi:MAG TPA: hypothetical protein VL588_06920 [Bdellovibrionota bacterium]|jgi:hypothetical protein|nr:hypothetical protein [Bdellovibrionota bacterium]
MVWKPKEKELTRDEAVKLAREEVAPYWIGSPPLVVAAQAGAMPRLFPIHQKFEEGPWLIHFLDPTTFGSETLIHYIQTLDQRYSRYGIQTLIILWPVYDHHLQRPVLESFANSHRIRHPMAVDYNRLMCAALGVRQFPLTLLIEKGATVARTEAGAIDAIDAQIQKYLRDRDPGLPLHPILTRDPSMPKDVSSLELGKEKKAPKAKFKGSWTQDLEGVTTADKTATLSFAAPSNGVGIVAAAQGKTIEAAKVFLEAAGVPAYDSHLDLDVRHDESGEPYVEVREPRLYHALHHLTDDLRTITLRFPAADRIPVKIFGIRFFTQA